MALVMSHTAENGAPGNYFRILRIEGICAPGERTPRWDVWVGFYASADIRAQNTNPLCQYNIQIPFSDLTVDPRQGAMPGFYGALKNYAPFAGQSVTDLVDDSPDIAVDAAKAIKIDEINTARLAANTSSFTYQGVQIACDTLSRGDIDGMNGYVLLFNDMPPDWVGQWKTMANGFVAISTVDDWKAFYAAMVAQGQANFSRAQSLKALVTQATSVEQVISIHWGMDLSVAQVVPAAEEQ